MADEIRFFTRSYTHEVDAVATSSGGSDIAGQPPSQAIDYDKDTWWENDAALPVLKIDLGAAYAVDSFWFKHGNIDTYTLYWSTDDVSYNAVVDGTAGSDGAYKWLFAFTERTARYWRLNVTAKVGGGNALVYEVLLMNQRLRLSDQQDLPAVTDVILSDKAGGGYEMADGSFTTFSGERLYANIDMNFTYLPKDERDNLYSLFSTPGYRSSLIIFPDLDEYPGGIFRVLWVDRNFPLRYQQSYKLSGWKGTVKFQEY